MQMLLSIFLPVEVVGWLDMRSGAFPTALSKGLFGADEERGENRSERALDTKFESHCKLRRNFI